MDEANKIDKLRKDVLRMREALFKWMDYAEAVCDGMPDKKVERLFAESIQQTSEAFNSRVIAEFIAEPEQGDGLIKDWNKVRKIAESMSFRSDEAGWLSGQLIRLLDETGK